MAEMNMDDDDNSSDDEEDILNSMNSSMDNCTKKRLSLRNFLTSFAITDDKLDSEFIEGRCMDLQNEFEDVALSRFNIQEKNSREKYFKLYTQIESTPQMNFIQSGIALVVGANKYTHLENLQTPESDAMLMKERFENQQYIVETLTSTQVTRNNILSKLEAINNIPISNESSFIFHYSGHGKEDRLCMPGFDSRKKKESSITFEELIQAIPKKFSRVLIILDCCHSGSIGNLQNNLNILSSIPKNQTIHVVCSTNSDISIEDDYNGLFSSSLARALRNSTLKRFALDAKVSFQRLFQNICRDVIHTSSYDVGYLQHPQLYTFACPSEGNFPSTCKDFYFYLHHEEHKDIHKYLSQGSIYMS